MKWSGRRQSENMEDRRGMSSGGKTIVGGGIIGIIILLLNVFYINYKKLFLSFFIFNANRLIFEPVFYCHPGPDPGS